MNKYYEMFRKNFPYIIRNEEEALKVINNPLNKFIDIKNQQGDLIATSIINKNIILMLCVNEDYRHQGIGTKLLEESERYIKAQGYDEVGVGVGDNYLMPGIPMAVKPYPENLEEDKIYQEVNNEAYNFFSKRGYKHAWEDANCFDMEADLESISFPSYTIGDTIDGITYRFAKIDDLDKIILCTDDAWNDFSKYYKNKKLYDDSLKEKVLIALDKETVCGTLIVGSETEAKGVGSVGCTTVSHKYRGRHIGVNMVVVGTKYLKEQGLKKGFLGYTYSGLDKMYGYAGYKICVYYYMAHKSLVLKRGRN